MYYPITTNLERHGHLKMTNFLKHNLNVKQCTLHSMMYGELGCFTLYIVIHELIVVFWYNLLYRGNKLSSTLYNNISQGHINYDRSYNWLIDVKHSVDT